MLSMGSLFACKSHVEGAVSAGKGGRPCSRVSGSIQETEKMKKR